MIHIHGSSQYSSSKKVDDKKEKDVAFKVDEVKEATNSSVVEALVKKVDQHAIDIAMFLGVTKNS